MKFWLFAFYSLHKALTLWILASVLGEALRYSSVYMREQKKNHVKSGLFCSRMHKAGNVFRGLKCHCQEQRDGFVKIYSNSSDSNLFRWSNLRQNPTNFLIRCGFCIMTKKGYIKKKKNIVHSCIYPGGYSRMILVGTCRWDLKSRPILYQILQKNETHFYTRATNSKQNLLKNSHYFSKLLSFQANFWNFGIRLMKLDLLSHQFLKFLKIWPIFIPVLHWIRGHHYTRKLILRPISAAWSLY